MAIRFSSPRGAAALVLNSMVRGPRGAAAAIPDVTVDNVVPRWDGLSGALQNSGVSISDANVMAGAKVLATGSTSARSLESRFADVFNVKDYGAVCDGTTDDAAAINIAISAAGENGGTVIITGLSAVGLSVAPQSNVTLKGAGWGCGLKLKDGANVPVILSASSATNWHVRDLLVDGNRAGQTDQTVSGIQSGASNSGFSIVGCKIIECMNGAVSIGSGCSDFKIIGNYIDGTEHGPGIDGSSGASATNNSVIAYNIIKNTQKGNIGYNGETHYAAVYGNICDTNGNGSGETGYGKIGDGITAYNENNTYINVCGNVIRGSANNGIHIGGSFCQISDNTIDNPAFYGVVMAAYPNEAPTETFGCVVSGNSIKGGTLAGIFVNNSTGHAVTGNNVRGNSGHGILIQGKGRGTVSGNSVRESGGSGILLFNGIVGEAVSGNNSVSNTSHGFRVDDSGTGSTDNTFSGNVSASNGGHGFNESNNTANNIYAGNQSIGNTGVTFNLVSTSRRIDVSGPTSSTDNALARFDGATGKIIQNSVVTVDDTTGRISNAIFPNSGLKVQDTNASHTLALKPGSDISADRVLTLTTGDADRTVTLNGNPTLNDWFDQSVKVADSPQFAGVNIGHASDTTVTRTGAGDIAVEGNAIYRAGGTDVPVADGGTGASTARTAMANLSGGYAVQSGVQSSHTGDTAEAVVATVAIPAGALGPNGSLRIMGMFSNNNNVNNKTFRIRWGASGSGLTGSLMAQITNTTSLSFKTQADIFNRNSASSQIMSINQTTGGWGVGAGALNTASVDTTAATEVVFTVQLANSADNAAIESYRVEAFYGA